jgi:hypothetical protein
MYQFINTNFMLAKVQDYSMINYVNSAKTILETLKVIIDKQIDNKPTALETETATALETVIETENKK